jgi:hypothetical protein
MKYWIITAALVALCIAAFITSVPAAEYKTDDPVMASVVCKNLQDMHTLVDMLNNDDDQVVKLLRDAKEFECYYSEFSNVPFFPVIVKKVIEHRGDRVIYKGDLKMGTDDEVYVFSIADPTT